jgi:drug/metabolite transporter (DMT)-like permease
MASKTLATLIGLAAIALWSTLALLTTATAGVPPFQLTVMTFSIAALMGLTSWIFRPGAWRAVRQPWHVWLLGVGGLFGYHAVYFAALRLAPPAEAGLIAYLWPLLMVIFSSLLPGERLKLQHIVGALLGFAGVAALAFDKGTIALSSAFLPGYLLAFACAFIWSGYSVLSRFFAAASTDSVVGFCLLTALLALPCHLLFETTAFPQEISVWIAVIGLGLGPVGIAFYAWDWGVKRGDIRLLGVASYATPLMSTSILVIAGYAAATTALALACLLIVAGAVLASQNKFVFSRNRSALQNSEPTQHSRSIN